MLFNQPQSSWPFFCLKGNLSSRLAFLNGQHFRVPSEVGLAMRHDTLPQLLRYGVAQLVALAQKVDESSLRSKSRLRSMLSQLALAL